VTAARSVKYDELAQQYARAAYQYTTQEWLAELKEVWDKLSEKPQLLQALADTRRAFSERQAQLDAVLPEQLRPDVRNFLYLLLREGNLSLLDGVVAHLSHLVAHGPGTQVAYVTSAVPLTAEERAELQARLQAKYGDHLAMEFQVDASLLGGVVVQVGDKVIDGSLAGRLNALRERLLALR
jgi:F-type H+-transporting ATPase subunit delta